MATIKIKFRASSVKTEAGVLYYQVVHRRVVRLIHTGYRLYPAEWDARGQGIIIPAGSGDGRRRYLLMLRGMTRRDAIRLRDVVESLRRSGKPYTADMVVKGYMSRPDSGFVSFSLALVERLRQTGKPRTAHTYATTINSFMRFIGMTDDIMLGDMESRQMMEYENYLRAAGLCPNTSSFYMRNLRAIYNRAVDDGVTVQRYPFRHVYTGVDKTVKRALPLRAIRDIKEMDLTFCPLMDFARDLFMFSFYTRGMAFVDMAFLRKRDLKNGTLSYRRRKTNQLLFIKWERPMQDIVDKYDTGDSPYILPIIRTGGADEWRQYQSSLHLVNSKLKKIGDRLGLPIPLTTYVARHGWASIAKSKNVPLAVISEAMGHDSENTTRIYLTSLDTSCVDRANRLVLGALV